MTRPSKVEHKIEENPELHVPLDRSHNIELSPVRHIARMSCERVKRYILFRCVGWHH